MLTQGVYYIIFYFLKILILFNTVSNVTPVSAATANHTGAYPNIPKVNTIAFKINENAILNLIIFILFFAIFIILGILQILLDINIPSAVLFAIYVPSPIEIPKSDSAKTGLSFIPSPTNTTFPSFFNSLTFSNFSFGRSE